MSNWGSFEYRKDQIFLSSRLERWQRHAPCALLNWSSASMKHQIPGTTLSQVDREVGASCWGSYQVCGSSFKNTSRDRRIKPIHLQKALNDRALNGWFTGACLAISVILTGRHRQQAHPARIHHAQYLHFYPHRRVVKNNFADLRSAQRASCARETPLIRSCSGKSSYWSCLRRGKLII